MSDEAPADHAPAVPADPAGRLALVRDALRTTPPSGKITEIADDMEPLPVMFSNHRAAAAHVEELTGLRMGELHALLAVADGARTLPAVAEATGNVDKAAAATVEHLLGRGLLSVDGGVLRLSAPGTAAVQQAEAMYIRVADVVSSALGAERAKEVHEAALAIGARVFQAG